MNDITKFKTNCFNEEITNNPKSTFKGLFKNGKSK